MQIVHPNNCALDVHKDMVMACLVVRNADGARQQEVRRFGTMTNDILSLRDWLLANNCPIIAMESTGVYWKPLFNLLEEHFEILLVNPTAIKQMAGRKTDVRDCQWIAELLEHGLLAGSYIPEAVIRDLRDLTRYRRKLVQQRTDEVNRLQKVLETANIKLSSVATDILGVSGRAMLAALIDGQTTPAQMAELAKGRMRNKKEQLEQALQGRFRPHHARLLSHILEHIDYLNESIADLEAEMELLCVPFEWAISRLVTIPGVERRVAQDLIAEIGVDMSHFLSQKHLCSWASICPGNHESAGKRKSGKTRQGNKWIKAILIQAARAASHTKDTYLGTQYQRLSRRKGPNRAAVAIAHSILESVYFMLRDRKDYQELGHDYWEQSHKEQSKKYFIKRLQSLGFQVTLEPTAVAA